MGNKTTYIMVDVMKILMSVIVVLRHLAIMIIKNPVLNEITGILVDFAVPYFFVTSAFFFFRGKALIGKDKYIRYGKKILKMYLTYTIVFAFFRIPDIVEIGFNIKELVIYIAKYIRVVLFIGEYQLWYLIGIIQALIMLYVLRKRVKVIYVVAFALFVIKILGTYFPGWYEGITLFGLIGKIYYVIFGTTRNGVFTGFIYMTIGLAIAKNEKKLININVHQEIGAIILNAILLTTCYIFLDEPLGLFAEILMCILITIVFAWSIRYKSNNASAKMRQASTEIYLSHMFFILIARMLINNIWLACTIACALTAAYTALRVNSTKLRRVRKG